ncbi:MAG TPA: hypothetical protein VF733_06115 [Candidatus Saccharimonadales bacterium]
MKELYSASTGYLHTLEGRFPFDAPLDPLLREAFLEELQERRLEVPPFSPEQKLAFAEQVDYVREHGDALQIPLFTSKKLGAASLALAAVVAPAAEATGNTTLALYSGVLLGAGGILTSWLRHKHVHLPRSQRKMAYGNQELLDERYELFTMPATETRDSSNPAHMALRYYGPLTATTDNPEKGLAPTTADRLRRIAELADEYGITEIIISEKMFEHITDNESGMQPMSCFLKDRGVALDRRTKNCPLDNDLIVSLSPQEAMELDGLRYRHEHRKAEINHLIAALRSISSEHPLVRVYDQYEKFPDHREKAMTRLLNDAVERDESLTETVGVSWKAEARDTSDNNPFAQKTRQHLRASLDYGDTANIPDDRKKWPEWMTDEDARIIRESSNNTVRTIWTDSTGGQVASKSLEQLTGLNREEMKLLLLHPESDRTKATTLFIGLLAQVLRYGRSEVDIKNLLDLTDNRIGSAAKHVFMGETAQEQLLPHKDNKTRKITHANRAWMGDEGFNRMLAGGLCASLLGVGSWLGVHALDNSHEADLNNARAEIARSQGIDANSVPTSEAQKLAYERSAITRYYGWTKDGATSLSRALPVPEFNSDLPLPFRLPSGEGAASSPRYRSLGNNPPSPNTAEWFLRTNGDISTEGYWASSTASDMDYGGNKLGWQFGQGNKTRDLELPPGYAGQAPSIEVERELTQGDGSDRFHVPVRQGTKIVAANLDGKPVETWLLSDNTYAIKSKEALTGNRLRFWLVEDPDAPSPWAIREIAPIAKDAWINRDVIRREWERVIPGFGTQSPTEQEVSIRTYITDHFDYRLNPYPESFKIDKKDPGGSFTKLELDTKQADCEAASTLTAINFATDNYLGPTPVVVNPAVGYLNKEGSGAKVLTSREKHQWNVNLDGEILDSTPTKNITQEDADYLAGRDKVAEAQDSKFPWGLGAVATFLVLGAVGLSQRERIQQQWHRIQRKRNNRREEKIVEAKQRLVHQQTAVLQEYGDDLHVISEVLQAALYDPKQDIAAAIKRAENAKKTSDKVGIEKLTRNDLYADSTIKTIKDLIRRSAGQEQQALERSLKAVKAARNL